MWLVSQWFSICVPSFSPEIHQGLLLPPAQAPKSPSELPVPTDRPSPTSPAMREAETGGWVWNLGLSMTPSHGDPMSSMSMSKDMDNVDGGFKHEFYIILFSISLRDVIQNPLTNSYFSRWAHCTTNQVIINTINHIVTIIINHYEQCINHG